MDFQFKKFQFVMIQLMIINSLEVLKMANHLTWFNIPAKDVQKSKEFYQEVFNWKFSQDPKFPDMEFIDTGSNPMGGISKVQPEQPLEMSSHFHVHDVDAVIAKVSEAGGRVIMPKTPIPEMGHFAMVMDPQGVVFGIYEELKKE